MIIRVIYVYRCHCPRRPTLSSSSIGHVLAQTNCQTQIHRLNAFSPSHRVISQRDVANQWICADVSESLWRIQIERAILLITLLLRMHFENQTKPSEDYTHTSPPALQSYENRGRTHRARSCQTQRISKSNTISCVHCSVHSSSSGFGLSSSFSFRSFQTSLCIYSQKINSCSALVVCCCCCCCCLPRKPKYIINFRIPNAGDTNTHSHTATATAQTSDTGMHATETTSSWPIHPNPMRRFCCYSPYSLRENVNILFGISMLLLLLLFGFFAIFISHQPWFGSSLRSSLFCLFACLCASV